MDVAQTVVAGVTAAELEFGLAGNDVEFIMGDQNLVGGDLEKTRQRGNRSQKSERPGFVKAR